jgi:adenylate cyclase
MKAKALAAALAALAATALSLAAGLLPPVQLFSLRAADLQARLFADPARADRRIVLVEIDQGSLDHFERDAIAWPWPRSLYNPLLEQCARGGAAAVLFDILFNNSSPYGEATDEEFAGAIRASGRVWLAAASSARGKGAGPLDPRFTLPVAGAPPPALLREALSAPLPALAAAAAGLGSVSQAPDPDGVIRRVPPGVVHGGRFLPGLALGPLARGAAAVRFDPGRATVGRLAVPVGADGALRVRFHGPRTVYARYSAAQVIGSGIAVAEGKAPAVPAEAFRGAYVIVGTTAPGLLDLKPTPLEPAAPAFGVHAAVLDNLLNGDFLAEAPPALSGALALALAGVVAAAVVALPVAAAAGVAAAGAAAAWGALALAWRAGTILDLWLAASSALLALIGAAVYRYRTEGRQRRFIAGAFSRYVSPKVVRQIIADPGRLALGGERREVTLFFSDLQGFTSISEGMSPQQLVAFLNEYTTLMADVIDAADGTIDKYIGDSVMAYWGAPLDQPDHARRAVLAALECQARLVPFCQGLVDRGGPRLVTRIGINSGPAVVGNMGSRNRFDYTCIGDTVNEASRLEGLNKAYHTLVLASESTWAAAGGAAFGRLVDRVRVKGKVQPVALYEPLAVAGAETAAQRALAAAYGEAFAAYQQRQFERALALAEAILRGADDGPAQVIAERARGFLASPPPPDWDGVFTHTSK